MPAHRALLAAASPLLLRALAPRPEAEEPAHRVPVELAPLRALVEYVYTGVLPVRDAAEARRLCAAAAALRMEAPRAHLAERLVRRLAPHDVLLVRALPALAQDHLDTIDKYIAEHVSAPRIPIPIILYRVLVGRHLYNDMLFENVSTHVATSRFNLDFENIPLFNLFCFMATPAFTTLCRHVQFDEISECGALGTLPLVCIEMLRDTSAEGGQESPGAVAAAALAWLTDHHHTATVSLLV